MYISKLCTSQNYVNLKTMYISTLCTSTEHSNSLEERRMRLAGHCVRHKEEEASKLVLQQQGKELIEANVKQPTSIPY